MTGRMQHFDIQRANLESLAILEQMVEFGAIQRNVWRIKHRAENLLHVAHMFADPDKCAGLVLDVRGGREVVGVNMGLQHPIDFGVIRLCCRQQSINRTDGRLSRSVIVVEHRIDHRSLSALRIDDQIGYRIGRLIEKGLDLWACSHGALPLIFVILNI